MLIAFLVLRRFVITTMKDNFGKMPEDIDKTYYSIIKIGGISLFPLWTTFLILYTFLYVIPGWYDGLDAIITLVIGSMALYVVGLRYDLQGASSLVRLLTIIFVSVLFSFIYPWYGVFYFLIIILATAYIIEMVKLLDGMNGLCSGTLSITLILLLILSRFLDNYTNYSNLEYCALFVIVPFWLMKMFSKKWKKVIMGSAGAYTMGAVLAYAFFSSFMDYDFISEVHYINDNNLVVALSIIMLPALDTLRVIGSRARDGRSIIMPDRNQINFKLLRTGMPNGAIFPTYILLIVFFAVSSHFLLRWGVNKGLVVAIEVALWIATELVINFFIRSRERRTHQKEWNRKYGPEVWDANVLYAQLQAKKLQFGSLELPDQIIEENEQEFISDNMSQAGTMSKRLFDIVVSGFCLVIFSPLFLLCYILTKLDDGKKAIYKQERIGRFGRPFYMYKFRTMDVDAEENGPQLSHSQGEDDPRLTKIGRFLRSHHLDELPQLWNVFCGDMSLVGYRPERKFYIDQIMEHDPRYAFLYQIRPGVSSYATLYNGYTDTMEKMLRRLELDLYYLAHRSVWVDCKILFLTFASILFGKKF